MNSTFNWDNLTTQEAAFAGGVLGTIIISICVVYIFIIIAFWKIFTKAGVKGWKSLIPIYNFYCALKIVGMSPWWLLWMILSSVLQSIVLCAALGNNFEAYMNGEIALPENVASNIWVILTTALMVIIGLYVAIVFYVRLAKVFKKGVGFTVGLILLPEIFCLILGFGSAKYDKKIAAKN